MMSDLVSDPRPSVLVRRGAIHEAQEQLLNAAEFIYRHKRVNVERREEEDRPEDNVSARMMIYARDALIRAEKETDCRSAKPAVKRGARKK